MPERTHRSPVARAASFHSFAEHFIIGAGRPISFLRPILTEVSVLVLTGHRLTPFIRSSSLKETERTPVTCHVIICQDVISDFSNRRQSTPPFLGPLGSKLPDCALELSALKQHFFSRLSQEVTSSPNQHHQRLLLLTSIPTNNTNLIFEAPIIVSVWQQSVEVI